MVRMQPKQGRVRGIVVGEAGIASAGTTRPGGGARGRREDAHHRHSGSMFTGQTRIPQYFTLAQAQSGECGRLTRLVGTGATQRFGTG